MIPSQKPPRFLTPAQESILHSLALTGSQVGTASALKIGLGTVKGHCTSIYQRTGCQSLFQLGIWYAKQFPNGAQQS